MLLLLCGLFLPSAALLGPRTVVRSRPCVCSMQVSDWDDGRLDVAGLQQEKKIETDRPSILSVSRVHALVFNPRTDNEGIYSMRAGSDGVETVLCFEDSDDAERYAAMLAAQDFLEATPVAMDSHFLLEFCDEGGHSLGLVRRGMILMPPEANVDQFDWSPGMSAEAEMLPEEMSLHELNERRKALNSLFSDSSAAE